MPAEKKRGKATVKSRTYTVYFVPDEEAGGYTAHIPALDIVTEGETLAEARMMARDAVQGRIAVLRELKQPFPLHPKRPHLFMRNSGFCCAAWIGQHIGRYPRRSPGVTSASPTIEGTWSL